MTRASRGRPGRIALLIVGLLALVYAGAVGASPAPHGAGAAVARAACPDCAREHHAGHDRDHDRSGDARAPGCAAPCAQPAIPATEPFLPQAGSRASSRPGPVALSAGLSTAPEPEPPRPAARA